MIVWLDNLSLAKACLWLFGLNVGMFVLAIGVGECLVRLFRDRPVTSAPDPITAHEIWLAVICVILNSLVGVAGWWLWKRGVIVLRDEISWRVVMDILVLLVAMDFLMYLLHRVAHHPLIFPIVHRTHHRFDCPRPINLFVLNPCEVLGFGALWLAVISVYSSTWIGMILYLTANLAFGTIGHLGV